MKKIVSQGKTSNDLKRQIFDEIDNNPKDGKVYGVFIFLKEIKINWEEFRTYIITLFQK